MDDFARKYLIGLLVFSLLAGLWWVFTRDTLAADLNRRLQADAELGAYVYTFRVQSVDDGIALMLSPRSAGVPVMKFLRAAFPELEGLPVDDPRMMEAQQRLATLQSRAAEQVAAHPEVRAVRWVLDERWYASRGIPIDPGY
jgi:hypothetical protein